MTTDSSGGPRARRTAVIGDPLAQLERMMEIRAVEDALNELYGEGVIRGSIHTYQGQEAIAVAAAAASRPGDWSAATYRGHGVALAFGTTPEKVIGEVLGRACGSIRGLGGSMHLADSEVSVLPTMAIVGAGMPIAVGAALTAKLTGTGAVSFAFFGDGATNIGAFHESLNLAALWQLPVIFVCENNLYGEYSPIATTTSVADIAVRGGANGVPATIVDGQDFAALFEVFSQVVGSARAEGGPHLIEAKTYRYSGHSRSDPAAYRPAGELDAWMRRDPIRIRAQELAAARSITETAVGQLQESVRERVRAVVRSCRADGPPTVDDLFAHVWA